MDGGFLNPVNLPPRNVFVWLKIRVEAVLLCLTCASKASDGGLWTAESSGDWKTTTATDDRRETKLYCKMCGGFCSYLASENVSDYEWTGIKHV
jgi:hypothetical protein